MAIGTIRAIKECGYKIPEDFSITGYDGMSFIKYIEPNITTVNQNMIRKGYEAARLLSDMIENNSESKSINVDYQFITGNSVKNL
ncbi:MAG: substrate-binding domain-containing protein [Clostridium sp.]|uniref:substrate-binding domain-containing protein n=1 Tax=Clostridium sp. TaxID=1506 RepID=UPI0025C5244A|nr:substrate-binding domain-containing protein [Clostridium sp.]MBS4957328.1 substrate-binding domain-containing protein [Clostridium sp.]